MSQDWKHRSGRTSGDHYIAPVQRSIAPGKVTRTQKLALQMRAAAARRPVAPEEPATRRAADAAPLQAKAGSEASEQAGQAEAPAGLLEGRALAKAQRNNAYYQRTDGFDLDVFLPGCQDPGSAALAQAIARFQQAHGGLVVDGIAGPHTCEAAGASGAADAADQAADASQIEPGVLDLDPALVGTGAIEPGVLPPPPTGDVLESGVVDAPGGDVLGGDVLGGDVLESGVLEMPSARPPSRAEQAVDRAAIDMPKEESLIPSRATISTGPVQRQAGPSETVAAKSVESATSAAPPAAAESGSASAAPRTSAADAAIERLEGATGGSQERFAVRQGAIHVQTVLQGALGKLGRQERAAPDHVAAAESTVRAACRFLRLAFGRGLRAPELVKLTAATNEAIKKLEALGWENPGPTELARPPAAPDAGDALQRRAMDSARPAADDPRVVAAEGVQGGGSALPHLDVIQSSFGRHDVSGVRAHVGGAAGDAAEVIGAEAFATGNDVAFREAPDLHTAAHEAAHVVQQRAGVQLKGGVGEAGDTYERHADAVADRVLRGESAEELLDTGAAAATAIVQRKETAEAPRRAILQVEPAVVPFPAGDVGQRQVRTVQIVNPGPNVVTVEDFTVTHEAFTVMYTGPAQLAPGDRADVQVVFLPVAEGWAESTVSVVLGGGARASFRANGLGFPTVVYGPEAPPESKSAPGVGTSAGQQAGSLREFLDLVGAREPTTADRQVSTPTAGTAQHLSEPGRTERRAEEPSTTTDTEARTPATGPNAPFIEMLEASLTHLEIIDRMRGPDLDALEADAYEHGTTLIRESMAVIDRLQTWINIEKDFGLDDFEASYGEAVFHGLVSGALGLDANPVGPLMSTAYSTLSNLYMAGRQNETLKEVRQDHAFLNRLQGEKTDAALLEFMEDQRSHTAAFSYILGALREGLFNESAGSHTITREDIEAHLDELRRLAELGQPPSEYHQDNARREYHQSSRVFNRALDMFGSLRLARDDIRAAAHGVPAVGDQLLHEMATQFAQYRAERGPLELSGMANPSDTHGNVFTLFLKLDGIGGKSKMSDLSREYFLALTFADLAQRAIPVTAKIDLMPRRHSIRLRQAADGSREPTTADNAGLSGLVLYRRPSIIYPGQREHVRDAQRALDMIWGLLHNAPLSVHVR